MSYYYKLDEEKSFQLLRLIRKMDKYKWLVIEWLENTIEMSEDDTFYVFEDIPMFTSDNIRKNPQLDELINKTNDRLNQRNSDSKKLISDWHEFKKQSGYKPKESYDHSNYAWEVRRYFMTGAITPLIDKENKVVYFKTDEPTDQPECMEEITLREFNEKEVELEENKGDN